MISLKILAWIIPMISSFVADLYFSVYTKIRFSFSNLSGETMIERPCELMTSFNSLSRFLLYFIVASCSDMRFFLKVANSSQSSTRKSSSNYLLSRSIAVTSFNRKEECANSLLGTRSRRLLLKALETGLAGAVSSCLMSIPRLRLSYLNGSGSNLNNLSS